MDQTPLFVACLRTVRTRNKELAAAAEHRLLPRRTAGAFHRRAVDIVASVGRLAAFLAQHRASYLSTGRCDGPSLTDTERDQVDVGAQNIMRTCGQLVRQFRRDLVSASDGGPADQAAQYRLAVADIMDAYLKRVCGVYAEMKAVRLKRSVDKRNMAQIVTGSPRRVPAAPAAAPLAREPVRDGWAAPGASDQVRPAEQPPPSDWDDDALVGDELSAEDQQQLEMENKLMLNELNSMTDEVQRIETKVVRIAELQQIFTEKVLEQERDIDRVGDTVVGTTENIKDANEQLRSAIKKNAGTRVWVMFFLLVISFSLLFLDWYND